MAETDVDGGTGDVSLSSLVECTDGDLEVKLEGPGGGWGDSSLATDGAAESGGVVPSAGGRGVADRYECVFWGEFSASAGFWVSELASASSTETLFSSSTLGARSPASSSDMSIFDSGLSGPPPAVGGFFSASDPFWIEWDRDSTSGSWYSDSTSGFPEESTV